MMAIIIELGSPSLATLNFLLTIKDCKLVVPVFLDSTIKIALAINYAMTPTATGKFFAFCDGSGDCLMRRISFAAIIASQDNRIYAIFAENDVSV